MKDKNLWFSNIRSVVFAPSAMYAVEFTVMLVAGFLLVQSLVRMMEQLFLYYLDQGSLQGEVFGFNELEFASILFPPAPITLVALFAQLFLSGAVFYVLYTRTRKAERLIPALLQNKFRSRFTYIALSILGIWFIMIKIDLISYLVDLLSGVEQLQSSYGVLLAFVASLFVIELLFTILFMSARSTEQSKVFGLSNKLLASILGAIIFVTLFASLWPLRHEADRKIDDRIISDFITISGLVDQKYFDRNRLPNDLVDIDLPRDVAARAERFEYELERDSSYAYSLCAVFRTSSDENRSPFYPYAYSDLAKESTYFYDGDRYSHEKGRDCIIFTPGGGFDQPVYSSESFTIPESGINEDLFSPQLESDAFEL